MELLLHIRLAELVMRCAYDSYDETIVHVIADFGTPAQNIV